MTTWATRICPRSSCILLPPARYLRDWLFFEVSPYVQFEEEEDWNTVLGFFGKIEIIFGFSGTGNGDRVDDLAVLTGDLEPAARAS